MGSHKQADAIIYANARPGQTFARKGATPGRPFAVPSTYRACLCAQPWSNHKWTNMRNVEKEHSTFAPSTELQNARALNDLQFLYYITVDRSDSAH